MRRGFLAGKWLAPVLSAFVFVFPVRAQSLPEDGMQDQPADGADNSGVWTQDRAREWYKAQRWLCGFNYIPANDISYTAMWMPDGFDAKVIDRELALAPNTGFNCLRVVLSYVDWQGDRDGFLKRFDDFLAICKKYNLRVAPCFFDDCVFGPITDPVYGPQPDVVPGWYANGWTPSPGQAISVDPNALPDLEQYVRDVMSAHKNDKRILMWDLYNESGNSGRGARSIPLLQTTFKCARDINPDQPITSCYWTSSMPMNSFLMANSDVITFHCYSPPDDLRRMIADLQKYGRPLICTEWMNRNAGSTVAACLPVFAEKDIGCMNWGLVNGKTQTNLNWGHRPGQPDPPKWQHDLYHGDLTPYDQAELDLFHDTIQKMQFGAE